MAEMTCYQFFFNVDITSRNETGTQHDVRALGYHVDTIDGPRSLSKHNGKKTLVTWLEG